jgi:glutamine amidotransferase
MAGLVVVDYGMGNLHSVLGALRYLGADPVTTADPVTVQAADALLLPGVGSFHKAMCRLDESGLSDALKEAVTVRGRKILGICLGQQLMAEYGEEDGGRAGLGFVSGQVTRLPAVAGLKVPHVGFNKVRFAPGSRLCRGLERADGAGAELDCYFVHSYRLEMADRPGLLGVCDYGGEFVAAYEQNNVFATQFHPEKSQTNGLRLLSNFLAE